MESVVSSVKDDTSLHFILDSMKRCFHGVGHQQYQGRHVFAVYLWFSSNEALMESVISNVNDVTSSQFTSGLHETMLSWSRSSAVSRTTRLRSIFLDSKKRSAVSRTTPLRSFFLDSKKRSFDGVGHQQYKGRHVFAVSCFTPRNEALMESVISSIKDDTSSQFYFWTPRNEALMESVVSSVKDDTSSQFFWTPRNEALMESVISSIKDHTSLQFISGLHETMLSWSRSSAVSRTTRLRSLSLVFK